MRCETEKLIEVYEEHGRIIVGCDFDDTVFPFNIAFLKRCQEVRSLLKELHPHIILCMFTVADAQSIVYKKYIMSQWEIPVAYVNESPVKKWGECTKPYFNILLDDKAGLNEAIEILTEFKNEIL